MSNQNRIVEKIKKLLNLANDQQGTPEGDVSLSRAMEMMARHGIEQGDIHEKQDTSVGNSIIKTVNMPYEKQQKYLIHRIANALNCYSITLNSQNAVEIFGRGIDRDRVIMLFVAASNAMVSSAMKAVPKGAHRIRLRRLSHMMGYADAISTSLKGHEYHVREESGDSTEIILADMSNAEAAGRKKHTRVVSSRGSSLNADSYDKGFKEGSRFDVGGSNRLKGQLALGQ